MKRQNSFIRASNDGLHWCISRILTLTEVTIEDETNGGSDVV